MQYNSTVSNSPQNFRKLSARTVDVWLFPEFVRSGDDSKMMWGSDITVTNAAVWQNPNGGLVNLGWSNISTGGNCLNDGLYVVKKIA